MPLFFPVRFLKNRSVISDDKEISGFSFVIYDKEFPLLTDKQNRSTNKVRK